MVRPSRLNCRRPPTRSASGSPRRFRTRRSPLSDPALRCKRRFSSNVKGKESAGNIGLRVKNIIAVGSGKGGVGKSTVAAALAGGMKQLGAKVGLLDADVYGPSIPHLFGESGELTFKEVPTPDGKMAPRVEPIESAGVKLLSIGFQIEKDQAVVWRGPMLHRQLTLFLQHSDWGELGLPVHRHAARNRGCGAVSLANGAGGRRGGGLHAATGGAAGRGAGDQHVPDGEDPRAGNGREHERATSSAAAERTPKRDELGVPFLGEVPIDAAVRIKGDEGKIRRPV